MEWGGGGGGLGGLMGERGLKIKVITVRLEVWSGGGGVRRFNGGEGVKGHS